MTASLRSNSPLSHLNCAKEPHAETQRKEDRNIRIAHFPEPTGLFGWNYFHLCGTASLREVLLGG